MSNITKCAISIGYTDTQIRRYNTRKSKLLQYYWEKVVFAHTKAELLDIKRAILRMLADETCTYPEVSAVVCAIKVKMAKFN